MALGDEGTYPLRVFVMMKKVRDGKSGEKVLRVNDPIYKPVMSMFYWTVPIQFSPKSGRFPSQSSFLFELLFNYGI